MDSAPPQDPCATWVSAVEECFVAIRGRGVVWAPADSERAARWYRAGVPLGVAIRVLQARVRAWQFRHGVDARLPMSLAWYEPAILQASRAVVVAGPGQPVLQAVAAEPKVEARLAELLDALPRLLDENRNLIAQYAYRKTFEGLDAAQRPADAASEPDPETLEAQLVDPVDAIARCRQSLRKTALRGLDEDQTAQLDRFVGAQLAGSTLGKKAKELRKVALTEQWLSVHLGLLWPDLDGWHCAAEATESA
ncbi:MAG: hypothetical protein HY902_15665 [Deltaproteobacteria bacterium]|nr:hypothetical protein [Deltaproteobacteria bacterium]